MTGSASTPTTSTPTTSAPTTSAPTTSSPTSEAARSSASAGRPTTPGGAVQRRWQSPGRAMLATELRLFLRDPVSIFFATFFPPLLLLALGLVMPGFTEPAPEYGDVRAIDVYTPVAISMAIATVALVTVAAFLSSYREKKILRRLATTPVGPSRVIGANLLVQASALVVASVLTAAVGRLVFDVPLPRQVLWAVVLVVMGTVSMCALAMLIAAVARSSRSASGIGTLVYFPMMFLAGVWTPGPMMPDALVRVADLTPLGAISMGLQDVWDGQAPSLLHLVVIVVWGLVCGAGAVRLFRWS